MPILVKTISLFPCEIRMLKVAHLNPELELSIEEIRQAASGLSCKVNNLYKKSCKHQLCYLIGVGKIGRTWALATDLMRLSEEIETRMKNPNFQIHAQSGPNPSYYGSARWFNLY